MTLGGLVAAVERRLRGARLHYGHGTGNVHDEAAFLVIRGLKLPFEAPADLRVAAKDVARIEKLVKRRMQARVPVPYLLNEAWLDGRVFYVDRRVIIPRSHIAELLRDRLRPWLRKPPRRVLDLCTGSGCLAILAAYAFPHARVDASDISADALAVARKNIRRHRLGARIRAVRSDLFGSLTEKYDLIVSNPPYVTTAAMKKLPREYRYEPGLALAGGASGLDLVHRIVSDAPAHLRPSGLLLCEIGEGRRSLERAFAGVPLIWPETAGARDAVFLAWREALAKAGARTAARARRPGARA